ncbi:unnamed protein product [Oppiella nova]|uniref:Tubulin polyglutamylase TTLL4 n=1 Tax=Oppiella nova TaxID=334625 RepID=A0A7R9LIL6_9ACAR|nr:unnamed protein product [Oppiella nova]CAG2164026.1 unnamed protein product [Oppiella nova]
MNDNCNESEIIDENYVNLMNQVINYSLNLHNKDTNSSFPRLVDSSGDPLVLQPSLFPMVWPTVYFALEDESISLVPNKLKPYLKWKLSSITANTMRTVVTKSGFRLLRDKNQKVYKNWSAIWCKHMKSVDFKTIKDYQKVNHFPGSFHFGRKDKLWQNLRSMAVKHGFEVFAHFHPPTFVLPHDWTQLKKYWINSAEELVFILKPPASARGEGIKIIKKFSEIPKPSARAKHKHNAKSQYVVQKYITNPCLLYNETKFDLRVYVLITSIVPLRVYVYDDGLVRFASHKYSNDIQNNSDNQFMHLTNYSVNKNNLNYVLNHDINGQTGNKWTLKTLWRYLNHSCKGVDVDAIINSIEDMIIKTVISCEPFVAKLVKENVKSRYSCFELLGFDIMLDNTYKPWLIEVNISPSLRSDSSLDSAVKSQLIKDMFNLIGHQIPPNFKRLETFAEFICFNRHYYSALLSDEETIKVNL